MVSNSEVGRQSQIGSGLDPPIPTYLYTDIRVCRLDPTFKEKLARPRIIVLVGTRFNVGLIPGLDVGFGPHFLLGTCPKFRLVSITTDQQELNQSNF